MLNDNKDSASFAKRNVSVPTIVDDPYFKKNGWQVISCILTSLESVHQHGYRAHSNGLNR